MSSENDRSAVCDRLLHATSADEVQRLVDALLAMCGELEVQADSFEELGEFSLMRFVARETGSLYERAAVKLAPFRGLRGRLHNHGFVDCEKALALADKAVIALKRGKSPRFHEIRLETLSWAAWMRDRKRPASSSSLRHCSGDMYSGVPATATPPAGKTISKVGAADNTAKRLGKRPKKRLISPSSAPMRDRKEAA